MADRQRIGGIKLSGELVQVDCRVSGPADTVITGILRLCKRAKINIPHLHQGRVDDQLQTTLCLTTEDYLHLKASFARELRDVRHRILPSVGTITVFPHGSSITFFAKVYGLLANKGIAIHGISTSVSAIVIHTDYTLLDGAVAALLTRCELPPNHTPFRPEFALQQVER